MFYVKTKINLIDMKNKTLLFILVFLFSSLIFLTTRIMAIPRQELPIEAVVDLSGTSIELEVARTPEQQQIGLMNRKIIPPHRGMLFNFEPPRYVRFWMKNVSLPLDMIFLRDGQVKAVISDVPPCRREVCATYGPTNDEIDQVIELKGGQAAKLGLEVGNTIEVKYIKK